MYKLCIISLLFFSQLASAQSLSEDLLKIQHDWAVANYKTDEDKLESAFEQLTIDADRFIKTYPDKAEPLIWKAIIVSSDAGKNGGLGALSKVHEARDLLLQAEKINATALDGSIFTSLGSLHYQVPGWPIGFGDDNMAKIYLEKALRINPNGIDQNYFYADYWLEQGDETQAKQYFNKAMEAPERIGRPIADQGRRKEISTKLASIENHQ